MYSKYLTYSKFKNTSFLRRYYKEQINYYFFLNYKHSAFYYNLLLYIYCGRKLYVEKQVSYSIQILYYSIE